MLGAWKFYSVIALNGTGDSAFYCLLSHTRTHALIAGACSGTIETRMTAHFFDPQLVHLYNTGWLTILYGFFFRKMEF